MDEQNYDMRGLINAVENETGDLDAGMLQKFVENSLFLTSQSHHWHLQAPTHTLHIELDELYKELPEFVDYFIENLMASRGPIIPSGDNQYDFQSINSVIPILEQYLKQCKIIHGLLEKHQEFSSVNALEDIMSFVNSIVMKLKFLP